MRSKLKELYDSDIKFRLKSQFGYKNIMQVPKCQKLVISMGLPFGSDSRAFERAVAELMAITGQKPVITKARKSIAGFKLRQGMPNGVKVTLRGNMMYNFIYGFINIALPRSKDFLGLSDGNRYFDGRGNFSMGIKEQLIFPEVEYDKVVEVRGMNICIVTTANTDAEAKALLKYFDFPFCEVI